MKKYDVFISANSKDYDLADRIYNFLVQNGFSVFLASHELRKIGQADYLIAIDNAIDSSTHMIVVSSSVNNIESDWVQREWSLFVNKKLDDPQGQSRNLMTILERSVNTKNLPIGLRYTQSFYIDEYEQTIFNYLGRVDESPRIIKNDNSLSQDIIHVSSLLEQDDSSSQDTKTVYSINGWEVDNNSSHSIDDEFSLFKVPAILPTICSRLWLHDFAFDILAKKGPQYRSNNSFSVIVSECLDLLEFLFLYSEDPELSIYQFNLYNLHEEISGDEDFSGKELLMQLYHDRDLWRLFNSSCTDISIILFQGTAIGGTSPLTFVFTSPQCNVFFQSHEETFYGEKGQTLFKEITPFYERGEQFQKYVAGLIAIPDNNNSFSCYIKSQFDDGLKNFYSSLSLKISIPLEHKATFPQIINYKCDPPCHLHVSLPGRYKDSVYVPLGRVTAEQLIATEFCIRPTNPHTANQTNNDPPLVLTESGTYDIHFIKSRPKNYRVNFPTSINDTALSSRILPNTYLKYPYLVSNDFFEDNIIALDFKADSEKFFLIRDNNNSFLLPIKQQYFEYFSIDDLRQQLHYEINRDKKIVGVTLTIPVVGNDSFNSILLRKVYHHDEIIHMADSTRVSIWPDYRVDHQELNHYSIAISIQPKSGIHKVSFGNKNSSESEPEDWRWHQHDNIHFIEMDDTFDFIRLHINNTAALLVPQFYSINHSMYSQLSIGIDLGHAYTRIALAENPGYKPNFINVQKLHVMNLNSAHDNIAGWKTELTEMQMILDGNDYVPLPPYLPANNKTHLFTDLFSYDSIRNRYRVIATEAYCKQMVQILHHQVAHESFSHPCIDSYHVNIAIPSCYSVRHFALIRSSWEKAFQRYQDNVTIERINDVNSLSIQFASPQAIIIDIGKSFTSAVFLQPSPPTPVCSYPIGISTIWNNAFRDFVRPDYFYSLWVEYYPKADYENIIQEIEMRKGGNWMDYIFLKASEIAQDIQTRLFDDFPDLRALVFTFFAAVIWKVVKNMTRIQATIPNRIFFYGQGIKPLLCFMSDYDITTAVNRLICSFSHQDKTASHIIVKYDNETSEIATCAAWINENESNGVQPFIDEERIETFKDIDHNELYNEFISFIHTLRDMKYSDLPFDLHHVCELFEKYASHGIQLSMHWHAQSITMPVPDATFFWPLEGSIPDIIREILLPIK